MLPEAQLAGLARQHAALEPICKLDSCFVTQFELAKTLAAQVQPVLGFGTASQALWGTSAPWQVLFALWTDLQPVLWPAVFQDTEGWHSRPGSALPHRMALSYQLPRGAAPVQCSGTTPDVLSGRNVPWRASHVFWRVRWLRRMVMVACLLEHALWLEKQQHAANAIHVSTLA